MCELLHTGDLFGSDLTKSTPGCNAREEAQPSRTRDCCYLILPNSDWQPSMGKWSLRSKLVGAYGVAGANTHLTIKDQSPMLTLIKLTINIT